MIENSEKMNLSGISVKSVDEKRLEDWMRRLDECKRQLAKAAAGAIEEARRRAVKTEWLAGKTWLG